MRLLTAISITTLAVSVAALVLVLWLVVTEPWATDESTQTTEVTVVTVTTPTPFQHRRLLGSDQVKVILGS